MNQTASDTMHEFREYFVYASGEVNKCKFNR